MRLPSRIVLSACLTASVGGCATLQQIAALRRVDFSLVGTSEGTLVGIPISSLRSFEDLTATDIVRVGAALSRGEMPVEADILVQAPNPADNVQAQLVELDWTLFLETMSPMDRDVPSILLIESAAYYHTDHDLPEYVPAPGLEAVARAYAKIIDEANELDKSELEPAPIVQ